MPLPATKYDDGETVAGTYDGNFWTYLVDWEWENWQTKWVDEANIVDPNSQRRHSPPDRFQPGI
eukprot:15361058-Ditylum_brightwellii.AAC.1